MRSISRSETTCSSCSASSCTSSQLIPMTCTRNSSTSRCRRSDEARQLFAGRREAHAAVRLVFGKSRFGERLDHRRRGSRGDAERRCHLAHRNEAPPVGERRLALVDRLEIILDRARRQHPAILSNFSARFRMTLSDEIASPQGKRRYVRTLFATIADRYDLITVCCRTGRTGGGSGGWSISRRRLGACALSILRPGRAISRSPLRSTAPALSASM